MVVLDLDLDFFVTPIAHMRSSDAGYLPSREYRIWSVPQVRRFLEDRCRLSTTKRVPGARVVHHNEVLAHWLRLESAGELTTSFDLVHVDAHSDLGLGDPHWEFVCTELLALSPKDRRSASVGKITAGNYLLFTLAFRLIRTFTFVVHAEYDGDISRVHFKGYESRSGVLELKRWTKEDINDPSFSLDYWPEPRAKEPPVPYHEVAAGDFQLSEPPDFVFLAESPSYVPQKALALADVVMEYVEPHAA